MTSSDWTVRTLAVGDGVELLLEGSGPDGSLRRSAHELATLDHRAFLTFHDQVAREFGLPRPAALRPRDFPPADERLSAVLTEPLAPEILYGYGDPSVLRVEAADGRVSWRMVVTSNDAPNAFPLLRSDDLVRWELTGFVFPEGETPAWTLTGADRADFWAPELHRVGDEYWLVFTARRHDRTLAIGLARSPSPDGPFKADPEPLVDGGVIDGHVMFDRDGGPVLVWKADDNDRWPGLLLELLDAEPKLTDQLFAESAARRTAGMVLALQPWARTLEPMQRFFAAQPLIEAVTHDFAAFRAGLSAAVPGMPSHRQALARETLNALTTRIFAQPLAPDGARLTGERRVILENDQPWEGHLVEGVWTVQHDGRSWLFYAASDFSTPDYGVGAAVADDPFGPYRKLPGPLLYSTRAWWGPGHPSVARGPNGEWRTFLHAFRPGEAGYKVFRALLSTEIGFDGDVLELRRPAPLHGVADDLSRRS